MSNTLPAAPWGTASPEKYDAARQKASDYARSLGFEDWSFVEVPVVWGDQDANEHVNNCVYFKWLERGRTLFADQLTRRLPKELAGDWSHDNKGLGLVLGSVGIVYIRPVFSPDTVLVAHKLKAVTGKKFVSESFIYSYAQGAQVAKGEAALHAYDYKNLKAATIPEKVVEALETRLKQAARL